MNLDFFSHDIRQENNQSKCSLGKVYLYLLSLDLIDDKENQAVSDGVDTDNESGGKHDTK